MSIKSLQIPYLYGLKKNVLIGDVSILLDKIEKNYIDITPWPEFYDKPKVSFSIAYNRESIFLKYDVVETEVLARYRKTNDPVHKDSCVEFFIVFEDNKGYYNLEFNRLGTCFGSFGTHRNIRTLLPVEILETIKTERTITPNKDDIETVVNWTLMLIIPKQVFCFHKIYSLRHKKCKVNFFKCGDDLMQPHYLAWNPIISGKPDFHLPEFFCYAEFM
jgi:Carbohydrate-binding family 9